MDGCIFCNIARSETEAHIVYEDPNCVAFLDINPLFPGHCLLIPRRHYQTLPDLPNTEIARLFSRAKLLCRAVEEAMGAEGTFVAMNNKVSQAIPRLHVHIVPRRRKDGLRGFFWPKHPYESEAHMKETAAKIRRSLKKLAAGRRGKR